MTDPVAAATAGQHRAAHPTRSSWVEANAGSGKTRVLTDRVARLLLNHVDPQKILCLTFTNAAANEMQNRLFDRLGAWAMMDDPTLRRALSEIGEAGDAFTAEALAVARTHFARALETPGGLKIQTIHGFCGYLLRRFPLEAGVSPDFRELDEGDAADLRAEVLTAMARSDDTGPIDALARQVARDDGIDPLVFDVLRHRAAYAGFNDEAAAAGLGIPPDLTEAAVLEELLRSAPVAVARRIGAAIVADGTAKEAARAEAMATLPDGVSAANYLDVLSAQMLTGKGEPVKRLATKGVGEAHPWLADAFADLQAAFLATRERLFARRTLAEARDLAVFARDFLRRYEGLKAQRGALDFDDLIDRARDLLQVAETAQWVLYKLDGGIEHILVDEAQDTAPAQWQVIDALSSGFGDHPPGSRTLFVVGDKKQSIFGFQGADPGQFDVKQADFSARLAGIGSGLQASRLDVSFRSAAPILALVDAVFADDDLDALGGAPQHRAVDDRPGRVDLWHFEEAPPKDSDPPWYAPVDALTDDHPIAMLAEKTATFISDAIAARTPISTREGWRPLVAGDVLVLVRRRKVYFHRLIAALKKRGVPVAGADRLLLNEEIAVQDLLSLLRFLDNPRDDLSLAETLRSPIVGLSEAALFALAHGRRGSLWAALRDTGPPAVAARLDALRSHVDFARPYEILERVLVDQGGRAAMIRRLGAECEDAIDELLAQALVFERQARPVLGGFLAWLDARQIEVKRDMETRGDQARVMTLHGAKGLEAPLVILADETAGNTGGPPHVALVGDQPVPTGRKAEAPAALRQVDDARQLAERRERARLLYVGLTRAESWLIVAGAGGKPDGKDRWFGRVQAAMETMPDVTDGTGLVARTLQTGIAPAAADPAVAAPLPAPDPIAPLTTPPTAPTRAAWLQPSDSDQAHALPGETDDTYDTATAMARGGLIHDLIDRLAALPIAARAATGARLIGDAPYGEDALAEALSVLDAPELAPLFAPGTLGEVTFAADAAGPEWAGIFGRIDRLVIGPDTVLAVDFKSNRVVPATPADCPPAIVAQMSAYAAGLGAIYPRHTVRTAVVWTRTASLMPIEHGAVKPGDGDVSVP